MERTPNGKAFMCSVKELSEHTSDVMRRMNEENLPVILTRMGRFVGLMEPLTNIENLEGKALSKVVNELSESERNQVLGTTSAEFATEEEMQALLPDDFHISEFYN